MPTFSYNPALSTYMDAVRSILADTDIGDGMGSGTAVLPDSTILANLDKNGWNDGLALCADSIAAEFARRASEYKAGSTDAESKWGERVSHYTEIAGKARLGVYPPPDAAVRPVAKVMVSRNTTDPRSELL